MESFNNCVSQFPRFTQAVQTYYLSTATQDENELQRLLQQCARDIFPDLIAWECQQIRLEELYLRNPRFITFRTLSDKLQLEYHSIVLEREKQSAWKQHGKPFQLSWVKFGDAETNELEFGSLVQLGEMIKSKNPYSINFGPLYDGVGSASDLAELLLPWIQSDAASLGRVYFTQQIQDSLLIDYFYDDLCKNSIPFEMSNHGSASFTLDSNCISHE
jgi:hypothetical protein